MEYIMRVATAVFELQGYENLTRADAMLRVLVTDPRFQPEGEWQSALRDIGRLCKGIHGKKPFALSNGCVGLGDGDFRVGDQVALLYGSAVPFVIRAVDGGRRWEPAQGGRESCYRLVGPVIVGGTSSDVWPLKKADDDRDDVELITLV